MKRRVRALCCVCGQLRTVSSTFSRQDGNHTRELERGSAWRFTDTLKCDHCGALTRHALLRDGDPHADFAEQRMYGVAADGWAGR